MKFQVVLFSKSVLVLPFLFTLTPGVSLSQLGLTITLAFVIVALALLAMGIGWFLFRKKDVLCGRCGYNPEKDEKKKEECSEKKCPLCSPDLDEQTSEKQRQKK